MVKPFAKQQSQKRSIVGGTTTRSANRKVSPAVPSSSQKRSVGPPSSAPKTQHSRKSSGDVFVVNDPDAGHIRRTSSTSIKSNGSSGSAPRKAQPYSPPPSFSPTNSREFKKEKEVDFFTSPTLLSRLIQNQKFAAAMARLEKQGPGEASVWVCTKRKLPAALQYADAKDVSVSSSSQSVSSNQSRSSNKKVNNEKEAGQYTFRQLPIHMACGSLFRVDEPKLRTDLEQLIARLVIAYPEGCARRDHQGRYPLHECIWYNAAPPIISALLMAAPEIARIPDMQGVTPSVLNEHRQCPNSNHKIMVRGMLKKSPEFWKTARQEAEFRMKHRDIPATDATITSTSVLASSITDEETIITNEKLKRMQAVRLQQQALTQAQQKMQNSQPQAKKTSHLKYQPRGAMQAQSTAKAITQNNRKQMAPSTAKVQQAPAMPKQERRNLDSSNKPIAWVQLEERSLALEQKLAESYEHIYALNQQLTEVKGAKAALQAKVDKFTNSDLGTRVVELENEKEDLQFHLARSKAVLEKHGISLEEENNADDMPPLPPLPELPRMNVSFSTEDTADNTSDENSYIEEVIEEEVEVEEEYEEEAGGDDEATIEEIIEIIDDDGGEDEIEGSAQHLSQEQEKLAMLKQQLQSLTNDHLDYQDRLRNLEQDRLQNMGYDGDVIFNKDDEMSTKSELTMDFTATPFHRLQPERPGPDGDASLVEAPLRMSQVVEEVESISRTASAHEEDQVGPLPPTMNGSVLGDQSFMTMDSVIAGAMLLNGGEGLSPELIAMWRATSVASVGTSMHDQAERYMEETPLGTSPMIEPPLQKKPGSDQASVV